MRAVAGAAPEPPPQRVTPLPPPAPPDDDGDLAEAVRACYEPFRHEKPHYEDEGTIFGLHYEELQQIH
eukprot:CAMPEP_0179160184 /NCGR_PEP_ID=MMETSP0796-20121207/78284_1 /TAXON_ID=73915 /ORGANISM="Pyrodinium bahamense, Strain pbaha01" /LENGTH=67 /DNA_ID=CAMNT_0020862057 /DNA_START=1 /DNA_END=201 /DNA_ORIENTATION=+